MKRFLVVVNEQKDEKSVIAYKIKKYLTDACVDCEVRLAYVSKQSFHVNQEDIKCSECVIVLGGDGTLLRVAKQTTEFHVPIIGVNLGHLGYLAEVEKTNIFPALDALLSGRFHTEERMMIYGRVFRKGVCVCEGEALNDAVITRGGSLQALSLSVYVNQQLLNQYHADGIIVATPTGSTAYNFSAGGPIVEPGADIMLLTPISPHTFMNRSIVLNASDTITVQIGVHDVIGEQSVEVNFDGANRFVLLPEDCVELKRSKQAVSILKLNRVGFLEVLHRKMSEN